MPRLRSFLAALVLLPSVSHAVVPADTPPNGKGHGFIGDIGIYPQPTGDWLTSTLCYCHAPTRAKENNEYEKAHVFQFEYYNYHSNATYIADHMCLSRARNQGDQCIRPNIDGDNSDWYMDFYDTSFLCKKFKRTAEEKIAQANSKRGIGREKRLKRTAEASFAQATSTNSTGIEKRFNAHHINTSPVCTHNCDWGPFAPDPEEESSHPDHDKVCFKVYGDFFGSKDFEMKFNRQRRKMEKRGQQGRVKTDFHEVQGHCEFMCQSVFDMPADMTINDKRADGGSRQFVYTQLDDMCDHCK